MLKPNLEMLPIEDPNGFQETLIQWYEQNALQYPWRMTQDPYAILISEVMLQQTTIQAVIENQRFERFLDEFPDIYALAAASEEQLLRAWEGLGYYNRVRNLQKTARVVIEEHEGGFPRDLKGLEALPGLGRYTAAAVLSFAYNFSAPLVDANVLRVFSRLFDDKTPINSPDGIKDAWSRAELLVSERHPRSYNAALMELGQQLCCSREVRCLECPVAQYCLSREPLKLPIKLNKVQKEELSEKAIWVLRGEQLLLQKETGSRRKGFWRLPLRSIQDVVGLKQLHTAKYGITKYKVTITVYEGTPEHIEENEEWIELSEIPNIPIASPIRRIIDSVLQMTI